jgi:hypothetical protein
MRAGSYSLSKAERKSINITSAGLLHAAMGRRRSSHKV